MKVQKMSQIAHKQRGVTLMELIASLAVMSVIVVGAVALYGSASSSEMSTTMSKDLNAIQAATKQIFNGQGTYGASGTNLNNILVTAKKIPTTIAVDTTATPNTLTHRNNGTVTVASTGSSFTIALTQIPVDVCIPLMTNASSWKAIEVTGGAVQTSFPIPPTTADTQCKLGTTMTFTN